MLPLTHSAEIHCFAWKAKPEENGRAANFVIKIIFYLRTTAIFIQEGYTDSRRSALPLLGSKAPPRSLFCFISPFLSFFLFFLWQFVPIDIFFFPEKPRADFSHPQFKPINSRWLLGLGVLGHNLCLYLMDPHWPISTNNLPVPFHNKNTLFLQSKLLEFVVAAAVGIFFELKPENLVRCCNSF